MHHTIQVQYREVFSLQMKLEGAALQSGPETKKQKLIEHALVEYRATREKFNAEHAEFFARVQEVVQKARMESAIRHGILQEVHEHSPSLQQKNMVTVSRFLELRGKSDTIGAAVKHILSRLGKTIH